MKSFFHLHILISYNFCANICSIKVGQKVPYPNTNPPYPTQTHPPLPYTLPYPTPPYLTLPQPIPSYPTLPSPTQPYPTLPYPTPPIPSYPTPPHLTQPHPTLLYPTIPLPSIKEFKHMHITKPVNSHATALICTVSTCLTESAAYISQPYCDMCHRVWTWWDS